MPTWHFFIGDLVLCLCLFPSRCLWIVCGHTVAFKAAMFLRRLWFKGSAALVMFLFASVIALADDSKISPDLLPLVSSNVSTRVNVIVQYTSPPQTCSTGLLGGLL